MSLEKLLQRINEKDDSLIKQAQDENKKEMDTIIQNFDAEVDAYSKSEWHKAKESIKLLQQIEEINLDIFKRKLLLEAKRGVLEDVYSEFTEKIKALDLEKYKLWLFKNIENFDFMDKKGELAIGIGNFVSKAEDKFSQDVISHLNSKNLGSIKTVFTKDIDFGFKYSEGYVHIDFSLESIISEIKKNTEAKISGILFN